MRREAERGFQPEKITCNSHRTTVLILWTIWWSRDHLQLLPDNWGHLIQEPKLSQEDSRVNPSLTVPEEETDRGGQRFGCH